MASQLSGELDFLFSMTRFVSRKYGQENVFKLRYAVQKAVQIANPHKAPWIFNVFLLFTRTSSSHPLLHDTIHQRLTDLVVEAHTKGTKQIRYLMQDPKRSVNFLPIWYTVLRDPFQ